MFNTPHTVIVIVIVIVILYSAGTYIYIMDEKSLKCDDALKDCWRNQQPKHKSLQNTTTKTHRYRTLRTFIARTYKVKCTSIIRIKIDCKMLPEELFEFSF